MQGKVLVGTSHSWWLYFALLSNADVIPGRPPRAVFVFSWEVLQWALGPSSLRHFPGKQVSFLHSGFPDVTCCGLLKSLLLFRGSRRLSGSIP